MKPEQLREDKVDQLGLRFTVDVYLAIERAQWREFIASIGLYPRQAHASVNFSSFSFAQEAAAVIDVDLRQYFKYIS